MCLKGILMSFVHETEFGKVIGIQNGITKYKWSMRALFGIFFTKCSNFWQVRLTAQQTERRRAKGALALSENWVRFGSWVLIIAPGIGACVEKGMSQTLKL